VLVATAGNAQTPGVPAKAEWRSFPTDPPTVPPLITVPSPTKERPPSAVTPPAPPAIGSRVVVYQKPAGGDRPVARGDEPAAVKATADEPPKTGEVFPLPKTANPKSDSPVDPKPTEIRLLNDRQLDEELLRSYNVQQLETYNRSTDVNRRKPVPYALDRFPPSREVRELLARPFPPAAPRSVLGAPINPLVLEPGYVVHRRLMFEEKNAERYGWDFGMAQPFVSAAYFYKDLLIYPMKLASNIHERYDTSAGKALPGSPVPYLLYPPELTFGGMAIGSMAIVGTVFLLP
jgi:hypothetical protein